MATFSFVGPDGQVKTVETLAELKACVVAGELGEVRMPEPAALPEPTEEEE